MTIIEKIIQDAKLVPKTLVYKINHRMELIETELEEIYRNPILAYLCAKKVPGTNIAKLENAVLSSPEFSYRFAKDIPGANKAKLENAVLSSPEWSYLFAFYISEANIEKLEDAVLGSPEYSYWFAEYIPKANKEKLEESIKKDNFWWNEYKIFQKLRKQF